MANHYDETLTPGLPSWVHNSTVLSVDGASKVVSSTDYSNSNEYPDSYYRQEESGIPMMYIYLAISAILIYFLVRQYGK